MTSVRRWSARRAQTEPLAALAALAAVCVGLTVYAGVLADVFPTGSDRELGEPTLERVWNDVATDGIVRPGDLEGIDPGIAPDGYAVRVVLVDGTGELAAVTIDETGGRAGRARDARNAPADVTTASRPVAIERGPGDVSGGRLRVEVWR